MAEGDNDDALPCVDHDPLNKGTQEKELGLT